MDMNRYSSLIPEVSYEYQHIEILSLCGIQVRLAIHAVSGYGCWNIFSKFIHFASSEDIFLGLRTVCAVRFLAKKKPHTW